MDDDIDLEFTQQGELLPLPHVIVDGMRRFHIALLFVAVLIVVAVFALIRPRVSLSSDTLALREAAESDPLDSTHFVSIEPTTHGAGLTTPLDPSVERWSVRSEAKAIEPAQQPPKPFTARRSGSGPSRIAQDVALDIREPALSWCAIVGIAEERRQEVADLVVRTQRKWLSLCRSAGSTRPVNAAELAGLREWRRDELGRIVGPELGDAFIAAIRAQQGF